MAALATRTMIVEQIDTDRFKIDVSTVYADGLMNSDETETVDAKDVVATIRRYTHREMSVSAGMAGGKMVGWYDFVADFARMRDASWTAADEFYVDARGSGRFGGEVDFGCFWRPSARDADKFPGIKLDASSRARVTWIENSGEIYATIHGRYLLLGRTRPNDRAYVETVLDGWATACMAAERLSWIRAALGLMSRSYFEYFDAAKAYGRQHGYEGSPGGWIYKNDRRIAHGWASAIYDPLHETHGLVWNDRHGRYQIVDTRPIDAQRRLPRTED